MPAVREIFRILGRNGGLVALFCVAAGVGALLLERLPGSHPPFTVARGSQHTIAAPLSALLPPLAAVSAAPSPTAPGPDPRQAGSPLAAQLNAPSGDGLQDVETLQALLRQYQLHLHHLQGLPIGNDSDLARALTGHNPMKLALLPANHPALGANGRLLDRWGTPYFIHPLGYGHFEIRSAGPDRKLFTQDDFAVGAAAGQTGSVEEVPPDSQ